ncbi:hypothetical protein [Actinomadura sp. 3N407]|uniref:hypothetical protein n=1 Tax=Actinomadura sp. 3N407 TaxID=3457423 RepID=UPI003FCEC180
MTTYITLVEDGPNVGIGSVIEEDPIAVTDPRMLPFSELLLDVEPPMLEETITGKTVVKLVTVEPLTGPTECGNGEAVWFEAPSWRVTGDASWQGVFGPQGEQVIEATTLCAEKLHGEFDADGDDPEDRYYNLVEDTLDEMNDAQERAFDALAKEGADRFWWSTYAFACTFGHEIVAIAARDLIDTVDGWTAEAHDLLTAPYRAAFGDAAPGAKKICA